LGLDRGRVHSPRLLEKATKMWTSAAILLLSSLGGAAETAANPGLNELAVLHDGEVRHGFTARASFVDGSGRPFGARFVHDGTGATADVLILATVPQISFSFRTVPVSNRGEPHVLEHLMIGRGSSGRYLQMLLSMRLASYYASTYRDFTTHEF